MRRAAVVSGRHSPEDRFLSAQVADLVIEGPTREGAIMLLIVEADNVYRQLLIGRFDAEELIEEIARRLQ